MDEAKITLSQEAVDQLLSVADGLPDGPARAEMLGKLQTASFASLYVLSRKAQSSEVRCKAAEILDSRLHADESGNPEPPPPDVVSLGELPPNLAVHRHFLKFCEGQQWVLTTRSGVRVATFPSEAELDQWWLRLKKQRGRILSRVQRGTPSE